MRSLLRILPFLPALGLLAALSTGTDNFLGPLAYWLGAVAACAVLLFFTLWAAKRRPGTLSFRHPSRYVRLVVGTLALSIYLSTTFWPLRLLVLLSEPFLRPRVTALLHTRNPVGPPPLHEAPPVFDQFVIERDAVQVGLGSCGLFTSCALAFVRPGPPPSAPGLVADHLYGPWWHFTYGPD